MGISSQMMPAIEVGGLRKVYGHGAVEALRGVSFSVERGELFGILGPNGAGKSTLVELLQGLLVPTAGRVRIFGMDYEASERSIRARIGGVLQRNGFYEKLRVSEVFELFQSFYESPLPSADVIGWLSLDGVRRRFLSHLSGGQRQRVFLGAALVGNPDILFLDEPTTGLDPASRAEFWQAIRALKAQGKTILLTTHYMEEAEELCDRLVIMDQGRIVEAGAPCDIILRTQRSRGLPDNAGWNLNNVFLALTNRGLA